MQTKNSYLRDFWDCLDFIIFIISLKDFFITLSHSNSNGPSFKGSKILRVLKPLRTIKRIPRMKKLLDNRFDSLSDLSNTLI